MRVESAPSLSALAGDATGFEGASEGLEIFVATRKIRGMEHLPDWTTAAGLCHYMLVARERGGRNRVRQWCFSPLDEEADTVWPWESHGPSPLLTSSAAAAAASSSPALPSFISSSSSSSSSLGSSPKGYSRSASLASLTSVASFSSFGGCGSGSGGEDASSVAGDSDSSAAASPLHATAAIRRLRKQRQHRNPVPGAVREEDLESLPPSSTLVGLAAPGLSLEAVGALAAAVAGIKAPPAEVGGEGEEGGAPLPPPQQPPLYEICVNDCRHFVDDLAASVCGARRAVRMASRAHWRRTREEGKMRRKGDDGDDDDDDEGGGGRLRGGEVAATASVVPLPAVISSAEPPSLSFSPLREQKQQQQEEAEQRRKKREQQEQHEREQPRCKPRQPRRLLLHRGAGDAALRAAQLLTDVDHWPAVAAAGKALALGALSAAAARPAAALLPCAALSLVLPADVKPAAGAAAAAVLRAPVDLAGAALRTGRAAAGAALRAAAARLRRRGRKSSESAPPSDGGNGRILAIPGLRPL